MRMSHARLLAFLILGFSADPAAAAGGQESTDMALKDAGFVVRVADTPAALARLRKLPARTFVRRAKGGKHYYLYVDPDTCKCVFAGDEDAMKTYRDMARARLQQPDKVGPGGVDPEREVILDMGGDDPVSAGDILDFDF